MAVVDGDYVELSLVQTSFAQEVINAFDYQLSGVADTVTLVNIAEAWWNDVKGAYRALISTGYGTWFLSVRARSLMSATGDYAEFPIPPGEQAGVRGTASAELTAPFLAAPIRLTVGSRLTRPGQKRISGMTEADFSGQSLTAGYLTLLDALASIISQPIILGAPAALTTLEPAVVRKDNHGLLVATQPITGYVTNGMLTTQNTRKIGHGS